MYVMNINRNDIKKPSTIYDVASYELGFEVDLIREYGKNNEMCLSELYVDKEKEELTNKLKNFSRKYKLTKLINKTLKK